jgi:hypothetical protein
MVRQHGSLEKDAETNQAAWEAAKGAAWGGSKVRISIYVMFVWNSILHSLHLSCVRVSGFVKAVDEVPIFNGLRHEMFFYRGNICSIPGVHFIF